MNKKSCIIVGAGGMDSSNLINLLLKKKYKVYGIVRRTSTKGNLSNIERLKNNKNFILKYSDILDYTSIYSLIDEIRPEEIYVVAAQAHVGLAFEIPKYTFEVNAVGVLNVLEAVRQCSPQSKVVYFASSEMFGKVMEVPQKETTPFYPRSIYGVSKMAGFWIIKNYRESYKLFCCSSICFNHTHFLRSIDYVEKKIVNNLVEIIKGKRTCLFLGNLDARRDIGWSVDYVKGIYSMLQQETPDDFILATGKMYSVRDMVEETCRYLGIKIKWYGKGIKEYARVISVNSNEKFKHLYDKIIVRVSKEFYRPCEVDQLLGDASKARSVLGWKPRYNFKRIIKEMVAYELNNKTK